MSSLMLFQIVGQAPAGEKTPEKITLERTVAEAREHNLELLAQRAQLPIADAQVITAGLRPNPTLSITADHLDALGTRFSELNGGGPSEYAVSTDFTWERAGKRTYRIAVAAKERAISEFELLVALKPYPTWEQGRTKPILVNEMAARLRENLPGTK